MTTAPAPMTDLSATMGAWAGGPLTPMGSEAEHAAAAQQTATLLKTELTLDNALRLALLNSPRFQSLYAQIRIAAADRDAAGQIQNPILSAQARPTFNPAAMANLEFGILTSLIDLLTQSARRRGAADAYQAEKLTVAADVFAAAVSLRNAYVDLVAATHAYAVQKELAESATTAAILAARFQKAGNIPLVRLREEQAAAADAAQVLSDRELTLQESREQLGLIMGVDAAIAWTVPSTLPAEQEATLSETPDVLAQRLDVQAARAAVTAAVNDLKLRTDWRLWRDINLEVSGERDGSGQWAVGPKLDIALPLFNQGRPEVARAAAEASKAQHRRAAVEQAAASDLRLARAKLRQAEQRLQRYRDEILPLHDEIVGLKLKEYNYMLLGAFDLLLARQATAAAQVGYVQALRDYWKARIALDAALGGGTALGNIKAEAMP